MGRWINPPLPERYAATPQRRALYNSARGNGRANCNPPAHPTQSYSLLAKHTQNAATAADVVLRDKMSLAVFVHLSLSAATG